MAASTAAAPNPPGGTLMHGDCLRESESFPQLGKGSRTVRFYLPPSYHADSAQGRRYPVVYLLHGWPGSDGNWVTMGHACETADSLISSGAIPEVILVFPNGAGPGLLGRSLWLDSWDGKVPLESWLSSGLVAWVDSTFRTRADARDRAVIGLSDGGTAAFNLAISHPGVFGAAASHSGEFLLERSLGDGGVVGPEPGASAFLRRNSPAVRIRDHVPSAREQVFYFDCGLADESLADNRAFDMELDSLGVRHTYHEFPGSHEWGYWRRHLRESLEAVTRDMRAPGSERASGR